MWSSGPQIPAGPAVPSEAKRAKIRGTQDSPREFKQSRGLEQTQAAVFHIVLLCYGPAPLQSVVGRTSAG